MQPSSGSPRTPSQFPSTLHKNLNAYTLSAAAAGVTLLAAAPPADAEIIFTPVNGQIASGSKYALDLNHDGVVDFTLENDLHLSTTPFGDDLNIVPAVKGNAVWQGAHERYGQLTAAALAAGVPVGSGKPFTFQAVNMAYASLTALTYVSGGPWKNATNRFLGLKFLINGEVHYGWARLTVLTDSHRETVKATLTGYAYETVANQPILTGQISGTAEQSAITSPATSHPVQLGLLALGSPGLSVWRREGTN
ncbi:MAG: hypothetical protein WAM04_18550 [Candidatus Sulfotelmatobacter sp.]